jgi:hypothetical protein
MVSGKVLMQKAASLNVAKEGAEAKGKYASSAE